MILVNQEMENLENRNQNPKLGKSLVGGVFLWENVGVWFMKIFAIPLCNIALVNCKFSWENLGRNTYKNKADKKRPVGNRCCD